MSHKKSKTKFSDKSSDRNFTDRNNDTFSDKTSGNNSYTDKKDSDSQNYSD